jgi:NAD+ synthase (glutamine-hydrolysing)
MRPRSPSSTPSSATPQPDAHRRRDSRGARRGRRPVVFPELAVTGYPPEDLPLRPGLRPLRILDEIARATGITALVACRSSIATRERLRGASSGSWASGRSTPPNTGLDEHRLFAEAAAPALRCGEVPSADCEDVFAPGPPATDLARRRTDDRQPSASPFHVGKPRARGDAGHPCARQRGVPASAIRRRPGRACPRRAPVVLRRGEVVACAPGFEEMLLVVESTRPRRSGAGFATSAAELERSREEIPRAIVVDLPPARAAAGARRRDGRPVRARAGADAARARLGIRDYVGKSGFARSCSHLRWHRPALTAAPCADALGPDRVHTVSMPSRYLRGHTRRRAGGEREPRRLPGDPDRIVAFTEALALVSGREPDLAEENSRPASAGRC